MNIVIKDFYSTWCSPCKRISPILDKLKEEFPDISIEKYDIEKNEDLVKALKIKGVPTVIIEKDGEVFDRTSGLNQYSYYFGKLYELYNGK